MSFSRFERNNVRGNDEKVSPADRYGFDSGRLIAGCGFDSCGGASPDRYGFGTNSKFIAGVDDSTRRPRYWVDAARREAYRQDEGGVDREGVAPDSDGRRPSNLRLSQSGADIDLATQYFEGVTPAKSYGTDRNFANRVLCADRVRYIFDRMVFREGQVAGHQFGEITEELDGRILKSLRSRLSEILEGVSSSNAFLLDDSARVDRGVQILLAAKCRRYAGESGEALLAIRALVELRNCDGDTLKFYKGLDGTAHWRVAEQGVVFNKIGRTYEIGGDGSYSARGPIDFFPIFSELAFAGEVRDLNADLTDSAGLGLQDSCQIACCLRAAAIKGLGLATKGPHMEAPELSDVLFVPMGDNVAEVLKRLNEDPYLTSDSLPMRAYYLVRHAEHGESRITIELEPNDGHPSFRVSPKYFPNTNG